MHTISKPAVSHPSSRRQTRLGDARKIAPWRICLNPRLLNLVSLLDLAAGLLTKDESCYLHQ